MNRILAASALAIGLVHPPAHAQSPEKPPPWWGVQDDVTVSLYWNFDAPFPPGAPPVAPNFAVVPPWYNNPAPVTGWTASANVRHVPTLAGHIGVLGLVGTGAPQQATLDLKVDNDPHLDWVKIFWIQFDRFEGASGDVAAKITQSFGGYDRAIVSETSEPIGGGWQRVTIEAQLIPQPDDEDVDWTFLESAFGTAAIDDLYVNSRCIKPRPDEDGDALGFVTAPPINLTLATVGADCLAVAATLAPTPTPQPRYWVAALAANASSPHRVFQLSNTGVVVGATVNLPSTGLAAPLGPTDLCVETLRNSSGAIVQEYVYAIVDERSTPGGAVVLRALDATTGTLVPARDVVLTGFPLIPPQRFGVAFDPSGDLGLGSFWVSAPQITTPLGSQVYEFSRMGQLLDTRAIPAGTTGLAYDDALGNFYCFSREPLNPAPPGGPVQVNGYEVSAYDFETTGARFCGDLTLANPGGPRGGLAAGLDVYRTYGGFRDELRLVCVAEMQNGAQQYVYELAGPFGYGYSRFGRCRMRNGPPFVGASFDVALTGVPTSVLAMLFVGFGDAIVPVLPEGVASLLPSVSSAFLAPSAPGEFDLPIALPNVLALGYQPVFFQWVVLDDTAPGLIGLSQAGKTVLYP